MKSKILLSFIIIMMMVFTSCEYSEPNKDGQSFHPTGGLNSNSVIVVEGCEYYVVEAYGSYTYVHKGNCSNPIHQQQNIVLNSPIRFYDFDNQYLGYIPTDSIVVNFKTKTISCFYQKKIAYMTHLSEMGMTTMEEKVITPIFYPVYKLS